MTVGSAFNGTTSYIESTTGTDLTHTNLTVGLLAYFSANTGTRSWLSTASTTTVRLQPFDDEAQTALEIPGGSFCETDPTPPGIPAGGWRLVFISKATGASAPRAHVYDGTTWFHGNLDSTLADASGVIDRITIGCEGQSGGRAKFFSGEIAWVGIWGETTSDATSLTYTDHTVVAAKANQAFFTGISLISAGTMADSSANANNETGRSGISAGAQAVPAWYTNFGTAAVADASPPPTILFGPGATGMPDAWQWYQPSSDGQVVSAGIGYTQDLAGSVTATGALVKQANKALAGSSTATGALTKLVSKALAGSVTSAGALAKLVSKPLAGSVTPSGAITNVKVVLQTLTGSVTASGALAKLVTKPLAGSSTATGALTKLVSKALAGSVTASGAITNIKVILRTFTGSVTASGTLAKAVSKALAGSSTPAGALAKAVTKPGLAGSVTASGVLTRAKLAARTLTGSVTATGALTKSTSKALAGSVTPAGALAKAVSKALAGLVTAAGVISNVTNPTAAVDLLFKVVRLRRPGTVNLSRPRATRYRRPGS